MKQREQTRGLWLLVALQSVLLMTFGGLTGCAGFFINTATTTTLKSSATNVVYGDSVTLTATVASSSATGTVTFYEGSTELGTATLVGGVATYTTTDLAEGTETIEAEYGGDDTYDGSTSAAVTVIVSDSLAATITTLSASTANTVSGMSVQLIATVSATAATGTVTFYSGSTAVGAAAVTSGVATLTTTALPTGVDALTAIYSGDSAYETSTSDIVTVTITAATTTSNARKLRWGDPGLGAPAAFFSPLGEPPPSLSDRTSAG